MERFVHQIFLVTIRSRSYNTEEGLSEIKNLEFVNDHNDLLDAMKQIRDTGTGPKIQFPSSGCSIKWQSSL